MQKKESKKRDIPLQKINVLTTCFVFQNSMSAAKSSSSGRELPPALKSLLEFDKSKSKQVFEWFDRSYGLQKHRSTLKQLEISCHGIPWLFGVVCAMYLLPGSMQLWLNLMALLILDIVIVAVIKVKQE